MSRFEGGINGPRAITQEWVDDQGLPDGPTLGRGTVEAVRALEAAAQAEVRDGVEADTTARYVLDFIAEQDRVGSNGHELVEALGRPTHEAKAILAALPACSVHGAVEAILQTGSERQATYLQVALDKYAKLVNGGVPDRRDPDGARKPADPEDIRTGLWRDIVNISMVGTPEGAALTLARRWTKAAAQAHNEEEFDSRIYNLPNTYGYHSYIFPPRDEMRIANGRGSYFIIAEPKPRPGTTGYTFPELAKLYPQVKARLGRAHPKADDANLEHKAVLELAHIITKSTEYNDPTRGEKSPYRSRFAEQLAWAQLGSDVQRQLRGMRRRIMGVDLSNIGRFIGKSGNNRYRPAWRQVDAMAKLASPDNPGPARDYLARTQPEATIDHLDDAAVLERFTAVHDQLKGKYERGMSLAEKALALHFRYDSHEEASPVDWINDASFGLIKRTYRALSRGVSEETALAYAVAEDTFAGATITRDLVEACRGLSMDDLDRIDSLEKYRREHQLSVDPVTVINLAIQAEYNDARDALPALEAAARPPKP